MNKDKDCFVCRNCDYGPCYSSVSENLDPDIFGQVPDPVFPDNCLYDNGEVPNWKFVKQPRISNKFCDDCYEWFCGEGYDKCPEWLQSLVNGEGTIRLLSFAGKIASVTGLLENYESHYWDREELLKELKKYTKEDMLEAIFPMAFIAGLIFGEMERQRRADGGEENITIEKGKIYE